MKRKESTEVTRLLDRARQLRGQMVYKDLGPEGYVIDWDKLNEQAKLIHEADDIVTKEVSHLLKCRNK